MEAAITERDIPFANDDVRDNCKWSWSAYGSRAMLALVEVARPNSNGDALLLISHSAVLCLAIFPQSSLSHHL